MGNWTFIDNNGYQWIWDGERVYLPEAENVENNGYPAESPNEAIQALINGGYIEPDYLDKEAVMDKQAILLKQEIVAAFMECEDGGDYLESGIKKFERKLDEILTAQEGETDKQIAKRMIEEFIKQYEYIDDRELLAVQFYADLQYWLDKEGE